MPGAGAAGANRSTWRARRSRCSAHSAAVVGSSPAMASRSSSEAAGRCGAPESRSRRSRVSARAGRRSRASGASAMAKATANAATPPIRAARGATCHRPSQDDGEEQRDERRRPHQRRPDPLEDDHRLGAARQRRQLRADARRPVAPRTVSLLRIQRGASAPSARRAGARQSSVAATTAEFCRGRSIPRRSAAAGRRRIGRP